MASQIGLLISFGLGAYLNWRQLAMIATGAPLTLLITAFVPESPSFLAMHGREEEAALSLQWLRGQETDISQEWNTIQDNVAAQQNRQRRSTGWLLDRRFIRPLFITCGVMLVSQISNYMAFNSLD